MGDMLEGVFAFLASVTAIVLLAIVAPRILYMVFSGLYAFWQAVGVM